MVIASISILRTVSTKAIMVHKAPRDRLPFNAQNNSYTPNNSWWLSEISRLIYVKENDEYQSVGCGNLYEIHPPKDSLRNQFLNTVGLQETWCYYGNHLQCALIESLQTPIQPEAFSILVFRGTQGRMSNWRRNLNAFLAPWPLGGKVHKGFKRIMLEHWKSIRSVLAPIKHPLFFTGHSLGGALATLMASIQSPTAVYTFGSPRVGDSEFVDSLKNETIFRITNKKDLVTEVPPSAFGMDFQHVGEVHSPIQHYATLTPKSHSKLFQTILNCSCLINPPDFLAAYAPLNYSTR